MEQDQAFLEFIVKGLVDNPESVEINRTVDEMGVLLLLTVHPDDMGKIIGKAGNTAKSIRTLLRVVGMKTDARVNLKIEEPEGGRGPSYSREESAAPEAAEPVAEEAPESAAASVIDDALGDLKI
ncbi:MAG: KH domain-containing protein [Candidatus Pacebacteria bacterium]|nr:KH domain-containing protein [Candidatus Paceibacterota bacterium]